ADVLADFIPSVPQWPTGALGDLTAYHDYCLASGLLLSPFLDAQRQASDFLMEILTASNADCVESEGVLKVIPLGDTAITANGVTYTPNLTPAYDLTWDQIVSGKGDDPIKWDFKRPSTAYNYVQVECLDRTQQYATDVVPAYDQANIDQYGMRKADPVSLHCIC
ncbi:phage tail protein, partial [Mycobacterium tuberculosis]